MIFKTITCMKDHSATKPFESVCDKFEFIIFFNININL